MCLYVVRTSACMPCAVTIGGLNYESASLSQCCDLANLLLKSYLRTSVLATISSFSCNRRHRCPHKQQTELFVKTDGPCKVSEYAQKFQWCESRPRESLRPPQRALTHDSPMDATTMHRMDYIPHQITPFTPKAKAAYRKPSGTIEKDSEYKLKYTGLSVPPPKPMRPVHNKAAGDEPFSGLSTQKKDFVDWGTPQRERPTDQRVYAPPTEKFQGISTVKADYVDRGPMTPTQSMKPSQTVKMSDEPFQSSTNYQKDFISYPITPKAVCEKEAYQPSKSAFSGVSTFVADFLPHTGVKPTPTLKPAQAPLHSDFPFEAQSVQATDFQHWDLPPKHRRPPSVYNPPKEKFTGQSSIKRDYKDYGVVMPSKIMKPVPRPVSRDHPFSGSTNHRADYQSWPLDSRAKPITNGKEYHPPAQKFSGESTFQTSYKGMYGPPSTSAKPVEKAVQDGGKMAGSTIYRDSFTSKRQEVCAAALLKDDLDPTNRLVYSHQDKTGHKFFSPIKEAAQAAVSLATGQA